VIEDPPRCLKPDCVEVDRDVACDPAAKHSPCEPELNVIPLEIEPEALLCKPELNVIHPDVAARSACKPELDDIHPDVAARSACKPELDDDFKLVEAPALMGIDLVLDVAPLFPVLACSEPDREDTLNEKGSPSFSDINVSSSSELTKTSCRFLLLVVGFPRSYWLFVSFDRCILLKQHLAAPTTS
jgi:hypothetical protein